MRIIAKLSVPALLIMLAVPQWGCRKVPEEHTSLALDPGKDPGPPKKRLTLMWHHHSTGDNLLAGGLRAAIDANNLEFYDLNYKEGKVGDYVVGDLTDPNEFPTNFNTPKYFEVLRTWELDGKDKQQHDIIMFKSCFPASDIKSDKMLADYKKWYNSMLPTFKEHKDILFIPMSTPPLNSGETSPENAARARAWARWITTEYARDLDNVQVFDLFGAMAILEGKQNENTLVPQWAEGKYDSHPTEGAARAVARMFIPWFNRAVRAAGLSE